MRCTRLATALIAVFALSACGSAAQDEPDPTPRRTVRPDPTPPQDALSQMELVFDGGHDRDEIQAALDRSLAYYGLEPTDANYRDAGDVLVALANHNAEDAGCPTCTEMAILEHMLAAGQLEGLEWHEAAALSSTSLVTGVGP